MFCSWTDILICHSPESNGEPDNFRSENELDYHYDNDDCRKRNLIGGKGLMRVGSGIEGQYKEPSDPVGNLWIDWSRGRGSPVLGLVSRDAHGSLAQVLDLIYFWLSGIRDQQRNYTMFNDNCHRSYILIKIHPRGNNQNCAYLLAIYWRSRRPRTN